MNDDERVVFATPDDITTLTFSGGFGDDCRFDIYGLRETSASVDYDDIIFYIDGKEHDPYTSKLSNWRGDTPDSVRLFEQVFNAYLRDDFNDFSFKDGWNVFDNIKDNAEITDGYVTLLPQWDGFDEVVFYELVLATSEGFKYYVYEDLCLMLNSENGIETDMENFYSEALYADTEKILNGDLTAKYTGTEWDLFVDAEFGEA